MSEQTVPSGGAGGQRGPSVVATRRAFLRRTALAVASGLIGPSLLAACTAAPSPAPTQAPAAAPTAAAGAAKPAATAAPAKAAPKELPKVSISSITGGVSGLIIQAMKTFQIDEKNGFLLDIKQMETAQAERAVLLKSVDIGLFAVPAVARANLEGFPLRITAPLYWMHTIFLVKADAPYQKWQELKGKKISSPGQVSGVHNAMQLLAAYEGWNFDKDFQVAIIGALPAAVTALDRGEIECALVWPPLSPQLLAEKGKYRSLGAINAEWKQRTGGDMLLGGLGMLEDWYQKNKDLAKLVSVGTADTNRYLLSNDQAWEHADILKNLGVTKEVLPPVRAAMKEVLPPGGWDDATLKSSRVMVDKFVELGVLKEKPKDEMFIRP
ncbi:MAG: ABC transporter substrate-binding protein [Chloroflexi bacterium]|nr:ABC transporter substrate-binding protein [Chloroflexota bacterium]